MPFYEINAKYSPIWPAGQEWFETVSKLHPHLHIRKNMNFILFYKEQVDSTTIILEQEHRPHRVFMCVCVKWSEKRYAQATGPLSLIRKLYYGYQVNGAILVLLVTYTTVNTKIRP